jgi:hypothetical protein
MPQVKIARGTKGSMLALSFVADAAGSMVLVERQEIESVTPRRLRRTEGQRGIYHRIVNAAGEVLFENVVRDPRVIPWDTTDDGTTLRGGIARQPDAPLFLNLPGGLAGTLEIFQADASGWTSATMLKTTKKIGTFQLE